MRIYRKITNLNGKKLGINAGFSLEEGYSRHSVTAESSGQPASFTWLLQGKGL